VAHSLSAKKRTRQNTKRRALNRARRTGLKTKLRKCQDTFQRGSLPETEQACRTAFQTLDREANRRTIHRNAAARRKSRMARRLNALKKAAPTAT